MTKFKNILEWSRGKVWHNDLGKELGMYDNNNNKVEMVGFIYPDGAWIEMTPTGKWHTIVANLEESNSDLIMIEDWLWGAHSRDNLTSLRDQMTEELKIYCDHHNLPHRSADELLVHCIERRNTFQVHVDVLTAYCRRWEGLED